MLPFPPGNPAKFQPPGMPITYYYSHRFNGRFVPEAEVNLGILNGSYWES
jgi:hypothetical protein